MPFVSVLYFYGILVAKHLHSLMDIQCCESLLLNLRPRGLSWLQVTPGVCIGTFLNQNYWLYTGSSHSYANGTIEISRLACLKLPQRLSTAVALQQQNSSCFAESRPLGTSCLCNKHLYNWSFYLLLPKRNQGIEENEDSELSPSRVILKRLMSSHNDCRLPCVSHLENWFISKLSILEISMQKTNYLENAIF